jgi:peptide chain release factor 2
MSKQLLFTLTRDDFEWQYFRSGGKGGQNQNKVSSGVRCIHTSSGARGESREERDQLMNRRKAFTRCCNTSAFKGWMKLEIARRTGEMAKIEARVDKLMSPEYIKVEYVE